jgi:hypothetical protein
MAKAKFAPKHLYHVIPTGSYVEPVLFERKDKIAARGTVARQWQDIAMACQAYRPRVIHNHEGSHAKPKARGKSLMQGGVNYRGRAGTFDSVRASCEKSATYRKA